MSIPEPSAATLSIMLAHGGGWFTKPAPARGSRLSRARTAHGRGLTEKIEIERDRGVESAVMSGKHAPPAERCMQKARLFETTSASS